MNRRKEIYPGWKMTVGQHGHYFRLLADACAAQNAISAEARERVRQAAHLKAFGRPVSAKEIDSDKMFTAIADEFKRLANVLQTESNKRRQLLYVVGRRLEELATVAAPNYVATLLKQRFKVIAGVRRIEDLTDKQLTELLSTVNNRLRLLQAAPVEAEADGNPF